MKATELSVGTSWLCTLPTSSKPESWVRWWAAIKLCEIPGIIWVTIFYYWSVSFIDTNLLAREDWTTNGISLAPKSNNPSIDDFHLLYEVVFVDSTGYVNLCGNMSKSTFMHVRGFLWYFMHRFITFMYRSNEKVPLLSNVLITTTSTVSLHCSWPRCPSIDSLTILSGNYYLHLLISEILFVLNCGLKYLFQC